MRGVPSDIAPLSFQDAQLCLAPYYGRSSQFSTFDKHQKVSFDAPEIHALTVYSAAGFDHGAASGLAQEAAKQSDKITRRRRSFSPILRAERASPPVPGRDGHAYPGQKGRPIPPRRSPPSRWRRQDQGVIRRMIDRDADVRGGLMQVHPRGRRRLDQLPQQGQARASLVRCQRLPPDLDPENVSCFAQPKIGDEQVWLDPDQRVGEVAVRFRSTHLRATDASTTRDNSAGLVRSGQRFHSGGSRLLQKLAGCRRSAARGAVAKFSETRGDLPASGLWLVIDQNGPEKFPMLHLGRTSVLGGPNAQAAHDVVIEICGPSKSPWTAPVPSNAAYSISPWGHGWQSFLPRLG